MKRYVKGMVLLCMVVLLVAMESILVRADNEAPSDRENGLVLKDGKGKKQYFTAGVNDTWYQIRLETGGYLEVSFQAAPVQGDVTLLLYQEGEQSFEAYTLLKWSGGSQNTVGKLTPENWLDAGNYYLRVKTMEIPEKVNYTIKYEFQTFTPEDQEPNGTMETAQALESGNQITARVWNRSGTQDIFDVYEIKLAKAQNIYVKLTSLANAGTVKVYLKNADAEILNKAKYQELDSKGNKESLTFTSGKLKKGTYYIYVALSEGNEFPYTLTAKSYTVISKISVNNKVQMTLGNTKTLKYTTSPSNATESVSYSSSNKKVVSVDSKGKMTAKGKGTAKITVKSKCFGKKAVCVVTVTDVKVSGIKLSSKKESLYVDDSILLKATVSPKNAVNKKVTWSSSDKSVATVTSTGKVTAKKPGTVTITVKARDGSGKRAVCKITILEPPSYDISLNRYSLYLTEGEETDLYASTEGDNTSFTWWSDSQEVAVVSPNGHVTARKAGTAYITVSNGVKSATCMVTIVAKPSEKKEEKEEELEITLIGSSSVKKNESIAITAQGGNKGSWSSSDASVASVAGSGNTAMVTGLKSGTVTITYEENGQKFKKKIYVKDY